MTTMSHARSAYASSGVATASPSSLLLMLYDRLVLDVELGAAALERGDRSGAHERLLHAQDILLELRTSLDLAAWPEGAGLAALYTWLHAELVGANVTGDAARARACHRLVGELREAWRAAAVALAGAARG